MLILTFDDMTDMTAPKPIPPTNWPYVVAGVLMAALGTIAVLVLSALRPSQDNSVLIATVIGFLSTTTGVIMTFMKAQETHLAVNSRLDAFMASARKVGHMEGREEGRVEGIAEGGLRTLAPAPLAQPTDAANKKDL
jgi:hypothetical protein